MTKTITNEPAGEQPKKPSFIAALRERWQKRRQERLSRKKTEQLKKQLQNQASAATKTSAAGKEVEKQQKNTGNKHDETKSAAKESAVNKPAPTNFSTSKLVQNQRKEQKKKLKKLKNRQLLRKYLDKAGYEDADESNVVKKVFRIVVAVCLFLTMLSLIVASIGKPGVQKSLLFLFGLWTGVFAVLVIFAWVVLYIFLDIKIFNRTMQLEEVLPDYLQLTSANISAGMPIDRALWFAVRPRFGILAKEIEDVAKSTISGEDLKEALLKFTDKYDSVILKRSINLLLEGMEAGGEMADLINKIALNIQETRILKKEMAANVMTYAIFIGFAAIVAAPVLFGLSGQLLIIIQKIMGLMSSDGGSGAGTGMFSLSLTANTITVKDFRIFSVATLFVTALFSSFIISIIRRGDIKSGMRTIPLFIAATLVLYLIASWILSVFLGGMLEL